MTHRYEIQQETDGLWRIVDIFSGPPVEQDGVLLIGLLLDETDDLLDAPTQTGFGTALRF